MIIDFHTHTFPDKMAEKTVKKLQASSHLAAYSDGTASGLVKSMAEAKIKNSVVLPVATNPEKITKINDISIVENKNELIYFGCMHPEYRDYRKELERLKNKGIKGIKLHPVFQSTDFDDSRYLSILEYAEYLGLITITHAGYDIGFPGAENASVANIKRAVDIIKPKKLVLAHMGGWRQWMEALEQLADTSVYIDTAFSLGEFRTEQTVYSCEERQMLSIKEFTKMINSFGADRVIFGTDSPWMSQKEEVEKMTALPIGESEKERIFYKNAEALLK